MHSPRIWFVVNKVEPNVILIQKIWRGYNVRKQIILAGVGALRRSLCHNDEDMVTYESKESVHPFDYFSFTESNKVWWFEVNSIARYVESNLVPTNPYTREKLTLDTRRRLRDICIQKRFPIDRDVTKNWIQVCQILEENGFEEINPNVFYSLGRPQIIDILKLFKLDIQALIAENPKNKKYVTCLSYIKLTMKYFAKLNQQPVLIRVLGYLFCKCLRMADPYPISFAIMSSLTRL